jgi:hypothetical protein
MVAEGRWPHRASGYEPERRPNRRREQVSDKAPKNFTPGQWRMIFSELNERGASYGLPAQRVDSLVLASWNLRQFGDIQMDKKNRPREPEAFRFMASVLMHFDLVAIQEIKDDLDSLRLLHRFLPEYDLVVSDVTGNNERLGFFSKFERVRRTNLAAEIDIPMVKMRTIMEDNWKDFDREFTRYGKEVNAGRKSRLELPAFLGFDRAPFCVSFEAGARHAPLRFLAYNTHIYYGTKHEHRTNEFVALLDWLFRRWSYAETIFSPNFIVFGDMNTEVVGGHATTLEMLQTHIAKQARASRRRALSRARREKDVQLVDAIKKQRVSFPFLTGSDGTPPPTTGSNLSGTERFDQIFLLMRSRRADTPKIAEYGVFDLPSLVKKALKSYRLTDKTRTERIRQQISRPCSDLDTTEAA